MTRAARQPSPAAPSSDTPDPTAQPPMAGSIRVATIGGIDIFVHLSWLAVFGLVAWSLATAYFPTAVPGATPGQALVLGGVAALLLFVSVLAHELAHSFVAKARGLGVHSITLFIFGGVSNLAGEAKRPGVEFQVAIVGPLTSFAIAALAFVVASAASSAPPIAAIAGYLAVVNGLLGLFNLVPGFPLDGGRVLRSVIWRATGNLRRATEIAAGVGQLVAWALLLWGFWRVLDGDILGGIWTAAIGWFLQNAAHASVQQTILEAHLRRLRVGDVIRPDTTAAEPSTSVADLIDRYMVPGARRAVPIVQASMPVGIVTLSDVRHVAPEQRAVTPVSAVMSGADGLVTVTPYTRLQAAIEAMTRGEYEQVPVVDDGRLVGLLTRADVIRQLQIREALDLDEDARKTTTE